MLDESSVERSVELFADLQNGLGYDILTDGEPRKDMIRYFVESIPGLGFLRGRSAVVGKISAPPSVDAFVKVKDYLFLKRYLSAKGIEKGVKVAVTGPVTLGFTCALGGLGPYRNIRGAELYHDLAISLIPIAVRLQELGAIIQVDEPGLSAGFLDPTTSVQHINALTSELKQKVVVHVCGRISERLGESLLKLDNVETLSYAFSSTPENIVILDPEGLRSSGKRIGVGCIRVDVNDPSNMDSVDHVTSVVTRVRSAVGGESISYVHPDCGLRNTPLSVAKKILQNLSSAISRFD